MGAGGRAEQGLPLVDEVATEHGLLVLLPTSTASTWELIAGELGPDISALDAALARVFAEHEVQRVAFAGFSDGASYALCVGWPTATSGRPCWLSRPGSPRRRRVSGDRGCGCPAAPPTRCCRCTGAGAPLVRLLRQAGYDVRYEEFDGAHVVPPDLTRQAVGWWLAVAPAPAGGPSRRR